MKYRKDGAWKRRWFLSFVAVLLAAVCWAPDLAQQLRFSVQAAPAVQAGNPLQFLRREGAERIIIFVHGFTGSAEDTWRHDRTQAFWPELIASDEAFAASDVATYSYETSVFKQNFSIDEIADNLRLRLQAEGVPDKYTDVVFIAHSMGGLVVRAFALKHRDLVSIPLAYFFSTPSNGADLAEIASLLSDNRQIEGMKKLRENLYLQSLSAQWLASPMRSSIRSYCAYETKKTKGVLVVPRESATALCNQRLDPISENHIRIVKPANIHSDAYVAFKVAYEETFRRLELVRSGPNVIIDSPDFEFPTEPPVLVADTITIDTEEYTVPDNALLLANDIKLNDGLLVGKNLSIVAASVSGGAISVAGEIGEDGGELLLSAGKISGTRILAMGGAGTNGENGADGVDGQAGTPGRNGRCDGFGGWVKATPGGAGTSGTDGTDGTDGGSGGDGGSVYLLALNVIANQPNVSGGEPGKAGQAGRGGRGGPGGRGGAGCTGLGGSQSSRASGSDGRDGLDGRRGVDGNPGRSGVVWIKQIDSLTEIAAGIPNPDEVADYANDIVHALKARARGS